MMFERSPARYQVHKHHQPRLHLRTRLGKYHRKDHLSEISSVFCFSITIPTLFKFESMQFFPCDFFEFVDGLFVPSQRHYLK